MAVSANPVRFHPATMGTGSLAAAFGLPRIGIVGKRIFVVRHPVTIAVNATLAAFGHLRESGWIADDETVVLFNTGTGHKYVHLWDTAT